METHKIKKNYRHGDVSLHEIDELPTGLKKMDIDKDNGFILAFGEVTFHHHKIVGDRLEIFQDSEGRHYLKVGSPSELTHQEHKTITILPGIYKQHQEQEFDYWSLSVQRVID